MPGGPSSFQAVPRSKVYTAIVEQIMDSIRAGTFPPGSALPPERLLAERLGVSRASLREAVRVLEHARVLDVRGGSGTYVTEDSLSTSIALRARAAVVGDYSPLDIIAARRVVEPSGAEFAARWRHDKDLKAMEESLDVHEEKINRGEDPSDPDMAFHVAVAAASHNDVLRDIENYFVEIMRQRTWSDLKHQSRLHEDTNKMLLDQHRRIYDAILRREPDDARDLMASHLDFTQSALINEVRE